ncbi:PREDICTED: tumor suppressor candidate 2-like [Priapulus caudatus]|uniref:Tumor suppressor candidate 2-like n=1 Tax=Priapulus caudatus TaxID=37621 RepID=A0ABM1F3V5_PRICU|nr:PREDICTED: tumor suppressor candidate 2-like [Priapulus caudatus]
MGNSGTRMFGKIFSSFSGNSDHSDSCDSEQRLSKSKLCGTPFVYTRRGSRFFDEDGDLAHEFYIEVPASGRRKRASMKKRSTHGLTPEGEVRYKYPRIHVDLPVVLYCSS